MDLPSFSFKLIVSYFKYVEDSFLISKITSNISTNFIVANGTYIEGPIYAFKSADTTGRFLVYFNAEY